MEQRVLVADEQLLRKVIREEIEGSKREIKPTAETDFYERLDRRKAAKFIGVSYQCMYNWVKSGFIKEHGKGRKKYFVKSELIEALQNKS